MNRERAPNGLAREIVRLRGNGPLPEKYDDRAREPAALWMEKDARRVLLAGATPAAESGLRREYVVTSFRPGERWPVNETPATAGAWEG